jgi:hypothetical protein
MFNLYVWVVVSSSGFHGSVPNYDWRYMGEFKNLAQCENAVIQLQPKHKGFRCVNNGK